jgi:hypothetical protein
MATVNITNFTITHTAANADFVLEYDVLYDDFDRVTDIGYTESWYLIGDDTGQDQDDGAPGDNQLGATRFFSSPQRAQGRTSVSRSHAWPYSWATLNEDGGAAGIADDEIRAVVKLEPLLPTTSTTESVMRLVQSP